MQTRSQGGRRVKRKYQLLKLKAHCEDHNFTHRTVMETAVTTVAGFGGKTKLAHLP